MAERSENRVGQQLGNYRLLRLLGRGGFAEVYLGEHVYLKSHAALKVLHTLLQDEDAEAFLKEAQTLVLLTHPHIVRVLDFAIENGTPFLVMEYAPQGTLRQRHLKDTRLPPDTIVHYVQQVASALQFAHDQHLIHRDVKPENMLLSSRDEVLLSDFGLAMLAPQSLVRSTQEMAKPMAGTILYLAPEQIQGKPSPASDQYALGVVVYEWLCGKPPFRGSFYEIATQQLWRSPPPLHEQVPSLSPAIEEVVLRALAKDPKQRFASVYDFATALHRAAQGSNSTPAVPPLPSTPAAEPANPYLTLPMVGVQQPSSSAPVSDPLSTSSTGLVNEEPRDTAQEALQPEPMGKVPTQVTPLVGRKLEWVRLQTVWQSASTGRPHLLVLSGEAGIGKTRLAEELLAEVHRQGIATASARCYAAEGDLAYTPVATWLRAEALHPALATLDAVWLIEVARLVPELLTGRADLLTPGPLSENWQRQRLFEALARAMLGTHQPLLLLLDDMQWCDRETLAWLHYLLRFDPHSRLLLLGTVRLEERAPDRPLESLLMTLRRDGQVTEVALEPLAAAETATLAGYVAGRDLDKVLAARLYRETEGNPLFVVEMMNMGIGEPEGQEQSSREPAGASPVAQLPPTIQAVIAARLEQLSSAARELVNVAAVIGRAFAFDVLKAASGRDEETLVQGLDELWQKRIVRERGTDSYDFSHDKLREGAYTALSRARRRLLHRRVAEALEEVYADTLDTVSGQIAVHYEQAGVVERAVTYYLRTADMAARLFAYAEARSHYTQALEVLSLLPATETARRQGVDTLIKLVRVSWITDDPQRNLTRLAEAEALAQDLPDPHGGSDGDRLCLARIHFWMSQVHVTRNEMGEAMRYLQQVLLEAQQLGDEELLALASVQMGRAMAAQGRFGKSKPLLVQAAALLEKAANWSEWIFATSFLGITLAATGQYAAGLAQGQRALARAQEMKTLAGIAASHVCLSMIVFLGGEIADMLEETRAAVAAAEQSGNRLFVYLGYGLQGWAESRLGRHEAAVQSMAQSQAVGQSMGGRLLIADWLAAARAENALAAGRIEEALALAEQALNIAHGAGGLFAEGLAQRVWGQAFAALDPLRWTEAEKCLAASLHALEACEAIPEVARTHLAWGMLCRDRKDPVAALEHLEAAAVQFEAAGLTHELERTRAENLALFRVQGDHHSL